MKKTSLLVLLSLTLLMSVSSFKPPVETHIKWLSFNEGYPLAMKKKKIMLVDVYTDWCGWCKRMDHDTYERTDVAEVVGKDFVAIKFNPEVQGVMYEYNGKKYNGVQLQGVIGNNSIGGYPATVFMYPKSDKRIVVVGYKNGEQMKQILEEMKVTYLKK